MAATAFVAPAAVADRGPSANGRLAFSVTSDTGGGTIKLFDGATGLTHVAFEDVTARDDGLLVEARELSWAPRGGRIAFSGRPCTETFEGCYPFDLFTVAADGTKLHRLTATPNLSEESPDWSPDRSSIAFVRRSPTALPAAPTVSEIWVRKGGQERRLSSVGGWDEDPSYSPDGNRIAFSTTRDGNSEIYVMNADGTQAGRLTESPGAADRMPTWSPDGSTIAWVSDGGGDREIWRMPVAGGQPSQLTDNDADDQHPAWSPDGTKIAFVSDRVLNELSGIFDAINTMTMNADGTAQVAHTDHGNGTYAVNPSWERINRPRRASGR
jgi:Tol biopolymer transport system component